MYPEFAHLKFTGPREKKIFATLLPAEQEHWIKKWYHIFLKKLLFFQLVTAIMGILFGSIVFFVFTFSIGNLHAGEL